MKSGMRVSTFYSAFTTLQLQPTTPSQFLIFAVYAGLLGIDDISAFSICFQVEGLAWVVSREITILKALEL